MKKIRDSVELTEWQHRKRTTTKKNTYSFGNTILIPQMLIDMPHAMTFLVAFLTLISKVYKKNVDYSKYLRAIRENRSIVGSTFLSPSRKQTKNETKM